MTDTDLFGEPVTRPAPPPPGEKKRRKTEPRGYAAPPGTGPKGETCRTCKFYARTLGRELASAQAELNDATVRYNEAIDSEHSGQRRGAAAFSVAAGSALKNFPTMTNEQAAKLITDEVERAEAKHPKWDGIRHGHSVIEEEYEEFKQAVFADDNEQAFKEAVQLGAMALRYIKNHAPSSVRLFH